VIVAIAPPSESEGVYLRKEVLFAYIPLQSLNSLFDWKSFWRLMAYKAGGINLADVKNIP
jgi:hypothetical protein